MNLCTLISVCFEVWSKSTVQTHPFQSHIMHCVNIHAHVACDWQFMNTSWHYGGLTLRTLPYSLLHTFDRTEFSVHIAGMWQCVIFQQQKNHPKTIMIIGDRDKSSMQLIYIILQVRHVHAIFFHQPLHTSKEINLESYSSNLQNGT